MAETIANGRGVWVPDDREVAAAQVTRLATACGASDFDALYRLSLQRPDAYWATTLDFLDVRWSRPYRDYVDLGRGAAFPRWFTGGRLNWVDTALQWSEHAASASRLAIVAEREDGSRASLTYAALRDEVQRFAAGLQRLGIVAGDRVGLLLPSGIEAVVALLALSAIGAIAVPLFTGFGAEAIVARLSACAARALLTVDAFRRRGRRIDVGALVASLRRELPSLARIVVKHHDDGPRDATADVVDWATLADGSSAPPPFRRPMEPDDPFMIIYTSGTTGAPKGTVHTHGGFPLKIAHDAAVHFNLGAGDVWLWPADMGWIVGPITAVGALMRGATLVCYDGAPDVPDASRLARLIERFGVTHFGASPTLIRSLAAAGNGRVLPSKVDISSVQLLITAGEVIDREHFAWFQIGFGRGKRPVINYTGGTEVSGALLASVVTRPIIPTVFNTGSPAIELDVVDNDGHSIVDRAGELVIRRPFVGMTRGFWGDEQRYIEAYWSRFAGLWVHGDLAIRMSPRPDGGSSYDLLGRSDDTLKIAGKRLGPAEVEAVALACPGVREAAAIGVDDARKGQRLILFVACAGADAALQSRVAAEVAERIELGLGKPFRPTAVYVVSELPRTKNSKLMRRIMKRLGSNEPLGDLSALENPSALDGLRQALAADHVG